MGPPAGDRAPRRVRVLNARSFESGIGGCVAAERAVSRLGALLLFGVSATHVYRVTSQGALPAYFFVCPIAMVAGCIPAARAIGVSGTPLVPQTGLFLGSALSLVILGLDAGTWEMPPAQFALAYAGAFIGLHASVLAIARRQRQPWKD